MQETLDGDWGAMKGYMRIERDPEIGKGSRGSWYYDRRRSGRDHDRSGHPARSIWWPTRTATPSRTVTQEPAVSTGYDDIGVDKPTTSAKVQEALASKKPRIFLEERKTPSGDRYEIRSGIVYAEGHGPPLLRRHRRAAGAERQDPREFTWSTSP